MSKRIVKEIISWILVLLVGLGLAVIINKTVIFRVSTPTGSMENTIMTGEKNWVFRQAYLFNNPERGDIVVFPFPDDQSEDRLKRIIGLPGETIEGRGGLVYIDGNPLEEPYVKAPLDEDFGPFSIPEGHYFMMGDNRVPSIDARHWDNKFVSKKKIKGKIVFN